ncbi:MAG: YdcF family protein [Pseudomonadota bacterium]
MFIRKTLYALLTPPSIFFIGLLFVVSAYHRRWARILLLLMTLVFAALSTPFVANAIHERLNLYPVLTAQEAASTQAQAIVVLSGGVQGHVAEYQSYMPNASSIVRALYAAQLHRQTGLPVLVTGGGRRDGGPTGGELIRDFMQNELKVPVQWVESNSQTTLENARYTHELLSQEGVVRIVLVTEGYHMTRSFDVFTRYGFEVTPAPTWQSVPRYSFSSWDQWIPTASDLSRSMTGLHEFVGMLWYRIEAL